MAASSWSVPLKSWTGHKNPARRSFRWNVQRRRSRSGASADEDAKCALGLHISVLNSAPAKLKMKCSISKTITDEIESQVDDPDQMNLL
jgi:hypothetical protein